MKTELPKCPQCGLTTELGWKDRPTGTCSVELKCPYNHHRVSYLYGAGYGLEKAREAVIRKWNEQQGPMVIVEQSKV